MSVTVLIYGYKTSIIISYSLSAISLRFVEVASEIVCRVHVTMFVVSVGAFFLPKINCLRSIKSSKIESHLQNQ